MTSETERYLRRGFEALKAVCEEYENSCFDCPMSALNSARCMLRQGTKPADMVWPEETIRVARERGKIC